MTAQEMLGKIDELAALWAECPGTSDLFRSIRPLVEAGACKERIEAAGFMWAIGNDYGPIVMTPDRCVTWVCNDWPTAAERVESAAAARSEAAAMQAARERIEKAGATLEEQNWIGMLGKVWWVTPECAEQRSFCHVRDAQCDGRFFDRAADYAEAHSVRWSEPVRGMTRADIVVVLHTIGHENPWVSLDQTNTVHFWQGYLRGWAPGYGLYDAETDRIRLPKQATQDDGQKES